MRPVLPLLMSCWAACCGGIAACGGAPQDTGSEGLGQISFVRSLQNPFSVTFLLVVDDAPDALAREMRQAIAHDLRNFHRRWVVQQCGRAVDPAYHWHIDFRLLVVGASNPTVALHPGNLPGLSALAGNATDEVQAQWVAAAASALTDIEAPSHEPLRIVDALAHWLPLLRRERAVGPREEGVLRDDVDLVDVYVVPLVATTRADESVADATDLEGLGDVGSDGGPHVSSADGALWDGQCTYALSDDAKARAGLTELPGYWKAQTCEEDEAVFPIGHSERESGDHESSPTSVGLRRSTCTSARSYSSKEPP